MASLSITFRQVVSSPKARCSWFSRRILSTPQTTSSRSYSSSSFSKRQEELFSSYQYPLAKEAPEVTRTHASQVKEEDHLRVSSKPVEEGETSKGVDRFDRTGLSSFEIEQIRKQQRALLPTKLSSRITKADVIPAGVPTIIPSSKVNTYIAQLTELDNGIRVVSKERSSSPLACTLGVISNLGSRNEIHPQQRGVVNLLELLSFATPTPLFPDPAKFLTMDLGGAAHFCTTQREQSMHVIDLLRPHVDQAFLLLQQVLLQPEWSDELIEGAKQTFGFQASEAPPEIKLGEALHLAAFGSDQQLGRPHCYMEDNPELTASVVRQFWESQFVHNPKGIVVSGVGIEHEKLVDLTAKYFGHLTQVTPSIGSVEAIPNIYKGGQVNVQQETKEGFVLLGLGLRVEGWHSDDLVPICVLQTLLGGGSSFSAGGPGKGMYSRLYRQVLNKHSWAESAEAFGAFYNEVGIFGLSGSTKPARVRDMMVVLGDHLNRLSKEPVTKEELDRARNMLRGNVLMQLESRLILLEDLGRQVLTYGHAEEAAKTCEKIHAVTSEDILRVAQKALRAGPPTVAAVGPDLSKMPSYDEVSGWFTGKWFR